MSLRAFASVVSGFCALLTCAGCPPPEPIVGDPSIEVLFPLPNQEITLNADCEIDTLIVVDVDNLDLVEPSDDFIEPVDGQGHWHGGPDLQQGFCRSGTTFCDDYESDAFPAPSNGSISVSLASNDHRLFGEPVIVELQLVAPAGVICE